ncbi:MAG TPA: phosphate ABC transporter permease PstA [Jatrophihabitantaceae bacterium]|nr:phosphate ABC transporter permease PstA [Jatrophihabitantaceae bacterium]
MAITTAPPAALPGLPLDDLPRALNKRTLDDRVSFIGAAFGSLALVWLVYFQLLPFTGLVGFFILWYVAFVAMYAAVSWVAHPRAEIVDRLMTTVMYAAAVIVGAALVWTIVLIFAKGSDAFFRANFFTHDMAAVHPTDGLSHGGAEHAIVGSLIILAIAVGFSLPLGLGTAIFLTEVGGRFGVAVRTVVEAMTAVPDLLAGLFVYVVLILSLGQDKTGFVAAIAIAVTMTPIVARSAEVALRVVPGGLREAGEALGASQWATVRRVVLPTALPGLATALILAIARGIGETAPLLIVSRSTTIFNANPFHNPMTSLPLFIYDGIRSPLKTSNERGYGAAMLLLLLVLVLFVITRLLARRRVGQR